MSTATIPQLIIYSPYEASVARTCLVGPRLSPYGQATVTAFVTVGFSLDGAGIDPELTKAYRGPVSLSFKPGKHSRVAVNMVDDKGVESLKVVEVV